MLRSGKCCRNSEEASLKLDVVAMLIARNVVVSVHHGDVESDIYDAMRSFFKPTSPITPVCHRKEQRQLLWVPSC
jgi:hypothetical protein